MFPTLSKSFTSRSPSYSPLPVHSEHDSEKVDVGKRSGTSLCIWKWIAIAEFLMIIIVGTMLFNRPFAPNFISPLVPPHAVKLEKRVFTRSIPSNPSIYQSPPSPSLDSLWEETYADAIFGIPDNELHLLPNRTARVPNEANKSITMLTVYHNLHCLNYLRKTLYPEYYPEQNPVGNETVRGHSEHCIDMLRQTSMCMPDTTPISWQWNKGGNKYMVAWDVTHTCLNYEVFHSWVRSRSLQEYNASIWVEGNPVYGEP